MDSAPLDLRNQSSDGPILSDLPGSYPWTVLHDRHPALVEQVLQARPYPPQQRAALEKLAAEIEGPIEPLTDDGPDAALWAEWSAGYLGRTWYQAPFLWAENYFYRKLLGATGYLEPGPWQGVDPFGPVKDAELAGSLVDEELAALDGLAELSPGEREDALILAALWGNRADLGFLTQAGGQAASGDRVDRLVIDDRRELRRLLDAAGERGPGRIVVVADNAGRELLPDLVLIDHLLTSGRAGAVVLHVKTRPYFVSDATLPDVLAAVNRLLTAPTPAARAIGGRLAAAVGSGRVGVRADPFSVAPFSYHRMSEALRADFAAATLTITKGDLNYRRLVGDEHWSATTPFAELTSYFPGPVVALRTLKSDVMVGLSEAELTALDQSGDAWRTSGTHALIQANPG